MQYLLGLMGYLDGSTGIRTAFCCLCLADILSFACPQQELLSVHSPEKSLCPFVAEHDYLRQLESDSPVTCRGSIEHLIFLYKIPSSHIPSV